MTDTTKRGRDPAFAPQHARISRNTSRIALSTPARGDALFTIAGHWRDLDIEGPDPTVVVLTCRTRVAKRNSEHRLTADASFQLPEGTESIELKVLNPSPNVDLVATVTAIASAPASHEKPWSYQRYMERELWLLERRSVKSR